MILKFETTLQEINKIWDTISITKENILDIMDILPLKKDHEAININSMSETLYIELSSLPKELSLEEFTLETLKSNKLSLITFGDTELAFPMYQIYQNNLSYDEIKLCYYIVSNINQTSKRFFNTNYHACALLSETIYEQDINKKISFFSTNSNFLTQNNLVGKEIPLSLEEKEQVLLNLPITTFLNHSENIKQNALNIDMPDPVEHNKKLEYFHKNTNYFELAKKSPDDKQFILDFLKLFENNPFEEKLSSNSLFIQDFTRLLGIEHSDFPSQELNLSILKNFFNNIIESSNSLTLQDKDIVEAIANTYYKRTEMSLSLNNSNTKIKDFLISNFHIFLNMNNEKLMINLFNSFLKHSTLPKGISKTEENKENILHIINFIYPEIQRFYSENLKNIDDILTPNKKAIKDLLCEKILLSQVNSEDSTFCILTIFPLLSQDEQFKHQLRFLKSINSPYLNSRTISNNIIRNTNFFPTYKKAVFSKINMSYVEENKETLALTLQPFDVYKNENNEHPGKGYLSNIFFKLFTNEIKNWIQTKDYSVTNGLFLYNLFKGKPVLDGLTKNIHEQINHSNEILEDSYDILKEDLQKLTVNDFEKLFSEIKKIFIVFKEADNFKNIHVELVNMVTLTHYYFRKIYPELNLSKTLNIDTSNYLDYSSIFPKHLIPDLFNVEMLYDFKIDENSIDTFRKLIRYPGIIEGINNNFSKLPQLKEFFLDTENIKLHIPSFSKTPIANKSLFLGNIYNKSDVANIFNKMGNDYSWISLSPFTFVAKAPQEVKNDPYFWTYIIKNLSTKTSILQFIPLNMIQNPIILEAAIEKFINKKDILTKTFPILSNLKTELVLKTLEHEQGLNHLKKIHPEAYNKITEKYPKEEQEFISDKLNEIIIKATSVEKQALKPRKVTKF